MTTVRPVMVGAGPASSADTDDRLVSTALSTALGAVLRRGACIRSTRERAAEGRDRNADMVAGCPTASPSRRGAGARSIGDSRASGEERRCWRPMHRWCSFGSSTSSRGLSGSARCSWWWCSCSPAPRRSGQRGRRSCRSFVGADSWMSSSSTPCSPSSPGRSCTGATGTVSELRRLDRSSFGAWLTVGAVLAISGLGVAASLTRPTIRRLVALGKQVAESGGPPSPETAARIGALQRRLVVAERVSFSLVLLAVVAMASARYL